MRIQGSVAFVTALTLAAALGTSPARTDEYAGGEVLDPDNGKVYRSKVRLIDDGKELSMRGYIGVPALGRSQIWLRQD